MAPFGALETHGQWPIVAAVALVPASAAAVSRPALRPLAALLAHQAEEWVWPGGFLPWINLEVLGSEDDEFPIDRRTGFIVNVVYGWSFSLATALGRRAAAPAALLYVSHLVNVQMHISWAAKHRRYDPGTITSIVTLAPVAISGLRALATDPEVSCRSVQVGAVAGLVTSAVLTPALRLRARRRRAQWPSV